MTLSYRTSTKWHDADSLLVEWHTSEDGARLIVMLDYAETVKARKDNAIAMQSQWRVHDVVYETVDAGVMPAGGLMRVKAERCEA